MVALLLGVAGGASTGYALNLHYGPRVQHLPELPLGLEKVLGPKTAQTEAEPFEPKVEVTRLKYLAAKPDPGPRPVTGPYIEVGPSDEVPAIISEPELPVATSVAKL